MKTFSIEPLFQSQLCALSAVRAENISWLIPSIPFPAAFMFSAGCCSSPESPLGLSLQPPGMSVKFLFAFSFTLLLFSTFLFLLWCTKILQFWLQKDNILRWRLIWWVLGKQELLKVLGLSCSQPSASPQAFAAVTKMHFDGSAVIPEDSPWG